MPSWLQDPEIIGWAVVLSAAMFAISLVALPVVIVRLPADYFIRPTQPLSGLRNAHPLIRWTVLVLKNLLGMVLLVAGVVMLLTPGQGLLAMVVGLMLLDIRGKRKLIRALVGRPGILRALNRLRARAKKPPLEMPKKSLTNVEQPKTGRASFGSHYD